MFDLIGKTIGPYRILEQIGIGGMAVVYKAYQPNMDRYVAVKVLPSHLSKDPEFVKRFQREARAIARLEHAHILPVHDYGEHDGVTYLVMRYVQAGTLKERMGAGPVSLDEVNRLIGQIGSALDYAHRMGIIHRDIKPGNVLVDVQGDTYLTDFGLARMLESTQQITASGVGLGTPAYMSPEQGQGVKVDHRSDIYSLGVILYEMLTGRVPYEAETPMAVVLKHITDELPLPRTVNPNVPEAVERVILKALAKEPSDRFQTAGEMVQALTEAVRQVGAQTAREPIPMPVRVASTPSHEAVSLIARIQQAWTHPRGRVILVGGVVVLLLTFGLILSRLPGRIVILAPVAPVTVTPLGVVQATSTAVPPTTHLTTPRDSVSQLSPGIGYGMDVFRRAGITSLAVNPADPDTVFAATNGAGIYVSHNGGKTWTPSNEGLGKATVAQIVIDPNNSNIVYAAVLNQGGVYKSTDGGLTWRAINLGIDLGQAWGWSAFIAIAAGDSNRLYYSGATNGLYLSSDGGESWQRISGYCPLIGGIAVDPQDANHIYLAGFDTGTECPSHGIYESTDGGQTLTRLTPDEMLGPAGDDWHLAVHARDFKTLYAASSTAVYQSGDGGRTWTPIRSDRCDWLDVNPEDGTVYCGQGGTIQISHDRGQSWTSTSVGDPNIGVRLHPFAITPGDPQVIYAGIESVMKSTDGGQTWLPVGQLGAARLYLTIDPRSSQRMFLSVIDNPCDTYRSEDAGKTWLPIIRNGSVCRITIDPAQGILYHHSQQSGQLQRSKDDGQTWELFSADVPPQNIIEVAVDPQDSQRLWGIGGCDTFLYVSQDGGSTFTELENSLHDLCEDSFVGLDGTGQRIYVGSWGNILRSDDGGQSWAQLANLGATLQASALDPSNSDVLYVGTTYKGLLKTTTAGQSWSALSNLPAPSVNDIAIDPTHPQTVYAATDTGAFVSLDSGGQWSRIQDGLGPNPIVYSIDVDPDDSSQVYAVTPDGVYRLEGISQPIEPLNSQAEQARAFAEPILAAIADRPPDFEDGFSADNKGWVTDNGCGQIIDGRLRTTILTMDQTTCGVHNPILSITNFVFEIDLMQSDTEVQGRAVVQWRHTPTGFYSVYVDLPGQRWELQTEHVPGVSREWSGPASGRLRVIGLGNQFAVYINQTPVFYLENDLYSRGEIDFRLSAGTGPITVEFDNVKLWNLDNVPGLP